MNYSAGKYTISPLHRLILCGIILNKAFLKIRKGLWDFFYFKIAAGFIFLAGITALFFKISNTPKHETQAPVFSTISEQANDQLNETLKPNINVDNSIKYSLSNKTIKRKLPKTSASKVAGESIPETSNVVVSEKADLKNYNPVEENNARLIALKSIGPDIKKSVAIDKSLNNTAIKYPDTINIRSQNLFDDLMADNTPDEKNSLKWSIGGQAGPQYSYRKINVNENANTDANYVNSAKANYDFNSYDSPLLAYEGGIQIEVEPAKRLTVQTGIYYSKIGQNLSTAYRDIKRSDNFMNGEQVTENQPLEIVNSIGTIEYPDPEPGAKNNDAYFANPTSIGEYTSINIESVKADITGKQYFEYIEIPLTLRYKILDYKIGVNILGGLSTNILINNSVVMSSNSVVLLETKTSNLKTFNYSGTIGFGFEYPLSSKIIFNLEPFFKYYLTNISNSSQAEVQPYMIGIMTGINYSF